MTYHRESLLVLSSLGGKVRFPEEAERLNEGRLVLHRLNSFMNKVRLKGVKTKKELICLILCMTCNIKEISYQHNFLFGIQ